MARPNPVPEGSVETNGSKTWRSASRRTGACRTRGGPARPPRPVGLARGPVQDRVPSHHVPPRALAGSRLPRSRPDNADDGRLEIELFDSARAKACSAERVLDLKAHLRRSLGVRPRAPWLGRNRKQPSRSEHAAKLAQPRDRIGPEAHRIHGEDLVEGVRAEIEIAQLLDRTVPEVHLAGSDAFGVLLDGAPDHHLRVVDADHLPACGEPAHLLDGDPRPESDLEHTVDGTDVEQRHDPQVPPAVRRAVSHDPAGQTPGPTVRISELPHDAPPQDLPQALRDAMCDAHAT